MPDAARARPVSYTHLDVYKRQLEESHSDGLLELSGAWAAHTTGADAPEMFEVPEPTAAPEPTSEPVSAVADGSDA